MKPLVIAGPTGAGKTALSLRLAERDEGVILCADSRQVYAGMVIGTAAPTSEERQRAEHRGFSDVEPTEEWDAGRFVVETDARVEVVRGTGRRALLVGGSGLYLRCWRYGLEDVPPRDDVVRARLEEEVAAQGAPALHARLVGVDPQAAASIEPKDAVRVVRALEILEVTGELASARRVSHASTPPRVDARWVLLEAEAAWLRPRLAQRAARMLDDGLVDEARALRDRLGADHRLLGTMGYAEALLLGDGDLDRARALDAIERRQWKYARRQRTWFRKEPWWERVDAALGTEDLVRALDAANP